MSSRTDLYDFQETVWEYYRHNRRDMPWRDDHSLYAVLVSEVMLQQTQVARVLTKYAEFMERFPTMSDLAAAPLGDVIVTWQGLGYNRRAKYLHESARYIIRHGEPTTMQELETLPGIGRNTAGAIMAYVYDEPTVFIETNIRTVYIHHFFHDSAVVSDKDIARLVEATIDAEHPREWYYALMDYGSHLKKTSSHLSQSKHYKKQSPLEGSVRQMRGNIIDFLRLSPSTLAQIEQQFAHDDRYDVACRSLVSDGLVTIIDGHIGLTGHH